MQFKRKYSQSVGLEPTLPEGIWFLVRRLNHSAMTAAQKLYKLIRNTFLGRSSFFCVLLDKSTRQSCLKWRSVPNPWNKNEKHIFKHNAFILGYFKIVQKKHSFEPDLNQRPMDICLKVNYSPPLYQLSYRRWYKLKQLCFLSNIQINNIGGTKLLLSNKAFHGWIVHFQTLLRGYYTKHRLGTKKFIKQQL